MNTNYHTHSHYCDGKGEPREYIEAARAKGFRALGFSGHAPLPFANDWTMSREGLPRYLDEIRRLREEYKSSIEIYTGLETDYLDEDHNPAEAQYQKLDLDYQIGSVHHLFSPKRGEFVPVDSSKELLDSLLMETFGGQIRELVSQYYRMVQKMVKTGGFDILGHLDLIKKHNGRKDVAPRYFDEKEPWYRKLVHETLSTIAESEILLEVNTGAMARGYTDEPYPSPWILEKASSLGIPLVLNADAHRPEWIDYGFREAEHLIYSAGYTSTRALLDGEWRESL